MKDIGSVVNVVGVEIRVAINMKKPPCSVYEVLTQKKNEPWIKQEGVTVFTSEEARNWAKKTR